MSFLGFQTWVDVGQSIWFKCANDDDVFQDNPWVSPAVMSLLCSETGHFVYDDNWPTCVNGMHLILCGFLISQMNYYS